MLETFGLKKVYRPKRGVPVTALDGVSLKFPDRGMVFLLGKSGSGKSTLLNVLGGLDRYDEGEIRIKGVSSKDFDQQHFDSYRNTYVGFIFQEYNILDEFNVGANIALAIQLQGKKADDEVINRILAEVDLAGFGNRKPNELSGGQKQRVAIARALVKNPEIIMADEPTGALDSATGKQVFDTLKKLSAEKLVIVVSHDREFAEQYADRIIELADGKVISDVTKISDGEPGQVEQMLSYDGDTVTVPGGYHLTEEDRMAINRYIDSLGTDLKITAKKTSRFRFRDTDPTQIVQSGGAFALIKSRLPMKYAFKMGAGGLKHKKFRLVMTILLSCIAFTLFGLADTFGSYDHASATAHSILDSKVGFVSLEKEKITEKYDRSGYQFSEAELKTVSEQSGIALTGVWVSPNGNTSFEEALGTSGEKNYLLDSFRGYTEVTADTLTAMNATLTAGKLPVNRNEIAVSEYVAQQFLDRGYHDPDAEREFDEKTKKELGLTPIPTFADLVGKEIPVGGSRYTVTGIVHTDFDADRYAVLTEPFDYDVISTADMILRFALEQEYGYAVSNGPTALALVAPGTVDLLQKEQATFRYLAGDSFGFDLYDGSVSSHLYVNRAAPLTACPDLKVYWLDGKERTTLSDKEIVVDLTTLLENTYRVSETGEYLPIFDRMDALIDLPEPSESEGGIPDLSWLADCSYTRADYRDLETEDSGTNETGYHVVGYFIPSENPTYFGAVTGYESGLLVASEGLLKDSLPAPEDIYDLALGTMPDDYGAVKDLVNYSLADNGGWRYHMINAVTYELDTVNELLGELAKVFLYIGLFFAFFAALLLSNFIGTSIAYKKQEIGILRAIGSRSNDVFRIFFSESFLIACINFVLSALLTLSAVGIINTVLRQETGLLLTILNFGLRQVLLLFGVSILIAAVASFLPVKRIASKRPIDAIRSI